MNKVATIILNRNLPDVTDALRDSLARIDGERTDIYVVEAGSDDGKLSRNCTWHANWPEAREHGLRYQRGMNYGLSRLVSENKFKNYDAFFLLTNDTEFGKESVLGPLLEVLDEHPRVGILSPCSRSWGERLLLKTQPTRYFWYIHNTAYLLRRQFVEDVMERENPDHMNCLFDGTNFRGYGGESELIAKGYANDWAAAITARAWAEENETHLLTKADLIRTESYEENIRLYLEEGRQWMRRKYGFNSRWVMQRHVKFLYDQFMEFYPEYAAYKV
jgi:GT2 family glycosyltransferase